MHSLHFPSLSFTVKLQHVLLFGHVACINGKADLNQILLKHHQSIGGNPWVTALHLAEEYH